MKGNLFLIPVTLGGNDFGEIIPARALSTARRLRHFVVEETRSARRFLRLIDKGFPIDESVFYELNKHTGEADISHFLDPCLNGNDMGLMSEAGCQGSLIPVQGW